MKIPETLKTEKMQHIFGAVFVIVVLIILPMWGAGRGKYAGGVAMLVASVIGLIAYFVLFGERLHSRGALKSFVVAGAIAAVIAIGLSLLVRGHLL